MGLRKKQQERRKYKRFKTCSGVFAVNSEYGLIDNICIGGLAFSYVEREPWSKNNQVEKGSLFGEDDMWIEDMPIKYISRCKTDKNMTGCAALIKKRRVAFDDLSPYKRELIEQFIRMNAKDADNQRKC